MSDDRARKRRRLSPPESGQYVLRKVLDDIPLATEDEADPVSITCVEFWNDNLYIGTSASEILHLVCLPPEDESDPSQYILASRLQPSGHDAALTPPVPGVQQILLLPGAGKAVVLCNGTASFYTLPELSPAFPNREATGVQWIGGYDENAGRDDPDGTTVMIATQRSIIKAHIGERLKNIKPNINYPSCLEARRRDTIACVADSQGYALLELEHQQKIPLFPVSSAPEPEEASPGLLSPGGGGHARSKSLGDFAVSSPPVARTPSPEKHAHDPASKHPNDSTVSRSTGRPRASTAETSPAGSQRRPSQVRALMPHILSPSSNEFMLTTGTTLSEPGVGMFVNLDGDVSRGTIEFDHYPLALLAYPFTDSDELPSADSTEQFIIALLEKSDQAQPLRYLQIQGLAEGAESIKESLRLPSSHEGIVGDAGLQSCLSAQRHIFTEIADLLQAVRFRHSRKAVLGEENDPRTKSTLERLEQETALFDTHSNGSNSPTPEYDSRRQAEELAFVKRFGHSSTRALVWADQGLWQLLQNPLLLQLEGDLMRTIAVDADSLDFSRVNVPPLLSFLGRIRDREPRDETEFLSIKYARQKASIILLLHLLSGINDNQNLRAACQITESALHEGEIDPRIVLSLLGKLSREVIQGSAGIWIHQGIVDCLSDFVSPVTTFDEAPIEFWLMIRHYLSTWQEKRGFGSISDEKAVFDTVDASLLHLLLHLSSSDGSQATAQAKLNNIVDHWKGDFDRAVTLLEYYKRLFILSRLYQSKRAAKDVLNTWRRVYEGDENADKNFDKDAALTAMGPYLLKIRDVNLVKEYALWIAQHDPQLAVQVLSDDESRVKFAPAEVVTMLKEHAPNAVQLFLEHLVFTKNLDQYADDLVGYYLDSVLSVLESSEQAWQSLADSYSTYRALTSPKPTYLNFIKENAPNEPWWQSRLRLLQLLGAGGYASSSTTTSSSASQNKHLTYSINKVLDRLKPFSTYLVSESIILDARQGRHNEALQLLVHGLGDYDTAVRYCYFGGPTSPSGTIDVSLLPSRAQQQDQFQFLFTEFLLIEDLEDRLDRTSHLLGTFATWFEPLGILQSIPDSWPVAHLSEFLVRTFRAATTERNQAVIIKALSAAQNLQKQAEFIECCEKIGAKLEEESGNTGGDGNGHDGTLATRENEITIS